MQKPGVEVLVVGAGPVGLTLAAALTHLGIRCRIIDKAAAPSDKSKALVVWSRSLELLDKLGLADTFINDGLKATGASIYGDGKRLVHVSIHTVDSPFGFPLMIPQNETERLLTEHLTQKGIPIERRTELVSFSEQPDKLVCKLRNATGAEETLEVPWVVGCDGAHSTVRHTLGVPFTGHAEPNDWLLADVHVQGPLVPNEVSVFWHIKGVLIAFPINKDRFRVIADLGKAGPNAPPDPTLADVQAKVDERGPGGIKLTDPIWLAGFRINERKVTDYRLGRVMLAGDAAHIHSPAGGQGMNTGMQDAFNLAWKLSLVQRGQAKADALLGSYSIERSTIGDQVLKGAEKVTTIATLRNPVAQYMRNHVAAIVTSFGFVQDKIANALCELNINYRKGPLSVDNWHGHGARVEAGDRLPDAPLTSLPGGTKSTLFAATRDSKHHLLLLPGSSDPPAVAQLLKIAAETQSLFPDLFSVHLILKADASGGAPAVSGIPSTVATWLDTEGRLHHDLGATNRALFVVRPDGYIGYRNQPADSGALEKYLDRYLVRKS